MGTKDLLDRLGFQRTINAAGHYTYLGGSILSPSVVSAMSRAESMWVNMFNLQIKACEILAEVLGGNGGIITSGAYSSLVIATKIATDISIGRKNNADFVPEVIIQESHLTKYAEAFRLGGAVLKIIRKSSMDDNIDNYISKNTVALAYVLSEKHEEFDLKSLITSARKHDLISIVDAAVVDPPISGLKQILSFDPDFIAVSGGKGLNGPSGSGLLLCKQHLLETTRRYAFPNYGIARGMKVGKEQIAGLIAAVVEAGMIEDDELVNEWNDKVAQIRDKLNVNEFADLETTTSWNLNFPQPIPRLFLKIRGRDAERTAEKVQSALKKLKFPIYLRNASDSGINAGYLVIDPRSLKKDDIDYLTRSINKALKDSYNEVSGK
jgi:L-seryl-tRNA(Ser) seleniumtransferase